MRSHRPYGTPLRPPASQHQQISSIAAAKAAPAAQAAAAAKAVAATTQQQQQQQQQPPRSSSRSSSSYQAAAAATKQQQQQQQQLPSSSSSSTNCGPSLHHQISGLTLLSPGDVHARAIQQRLRLPTNFVAKKQAHVEKPLFPESRWLDYWGSVSAHSCATESPSRLCFLPTLLSTP